MNVTLLLFAASSLLHWDGSTPFLRDEANQPVMLYGHYYPGVPMNVMANPPAGNGTTGEAPYSINTYTNMATQYGWNYIRLWQPEQANGPPYTSTNLMFDVYPWARPGPGLAADNSNKWDMATFDPTYFTRLTNVIQSFDSLGIYCGVMLQSGFSGEITQRFATNMWYSGNNINGHVTRTNDWWNTNDFTWRSYMTNYVRQVCDTIQPYKNVILEIANEPPGASTNYIFDLASYAQAYEATLTIKHPIMWTALSETYLANADSYLARFITVSNVGAVMMPGQNGGIYTNNPPRVTSTYPQLHDTDHTFATSGTVSNACQSLVRGFCGYSDLETTFWEPTNDAATVAIKTGLKNVRQMAGHFNFTTGGPSNNYCSSGYAYTNTFGQSLSFVPSLAAVTITHPTGFLRFSLYDPTVGPDTLTNWGTYIASSSSDSWTLPGTYPYGFILVEPYVGPTGIEFGADLTDWIDCGMITNNLVTNALTVSCWIIPHTNSVSANLGQRLMSNAGTYFILDRTRLDLGNNATDNFSLTNAITGVDAIYFVAATRASNGTCRLYINGLLNNTGSNTGDMTPGGNWVIGNDSGGTHIKGFVGWMCDCQVYNTALTDLQIKAMYLSQKSGPIQTANLVAWWPMVDSSQGASINGGTIRDFSGHGHNGIGHKGAAGVMVQRLGNLLLR